MYSQPDSMCRFPTPHRLDSNSLAVSRHAMISLLQKGKQSRPSDRADGPPYMHKAMLSVGGVWWLSHQASTTTNKSRYHNPRVATKARN